MIACHVRQEARNRTDARRPGVCGPGLSDPVVETGVGTLCRRRWPATLRQRRRAEPIDEIKRSNGIRRWNHQRPPRSLGQRTVSPARTRPYRIRLEDQFFDLCEGLR